jgi:hypothetical protein
MGVVIRELEPARNKRNEYENNDVGGNNATNDAVAFAVGYETFSVYHSHGSQLKLKGSETWMPN